MSLLEIKNLKTYFHTRAGTTRAVDDVSFSIDKGEIVGVVGESGSGKSVTCHTMLGLLPQPPAKVEGGSVTFNHRSDFAVDLTHAEVVSEEFLSGKSDVGDIDFDVGIVERFGGFDMGLCDLDGAGSTDVGRDDSPGIEVLRFRDLGLFFELLGEVLLVPFFAEKCFDNHVGDVGKQVVLEHREGEKHDAMNDN